MPRNEEVLCFKVLQPQEHDLRRVLKESCSVLLLPFLHPVAVDAEGAAVDKLADTADGVWISGQHLAGQWPHPTVTAVHSDAGEHAHYQHLERQNDSSLCCVLFLKLLIKELQAHPKCLSGAEEAHILFLVLSEEGVC